MECFDRGCDMFCRQHQKAIEILSDLQIMLNDLPNSHLGSSPHSCYSVSVLMPFFTLKFNIKISLFLISKV